MTGNARHHDVRASNARTPASPPVRAQADSLGVALSSVTGSGPGGRIRIADVTAAAGSRSSRSESAPRSARPPRPRLVVEEQSVWTPTMRVEGASGLVRGQPPIVGVDVFGPNPLLEDMKQAVPSQYAEAVKRNGTPPTLFAVADLPLFLASSLDTQLLLQLPWVLRHAAASIDSGNKLSALFETFGSPDETTYFAARNAAAGDESWWKPNVLYHDRFLAWGTV